MKYQTVPSREALREHRLEYRWGFPTKLLVQHNRKTAVIISEQKACAPSEAGAFRPHLWQKLRRTQHVYQWSGKGKKEVEREDDKLFPLP
ncbi:Hypothetical predicted protein [Pelobates cultripes]|uniref:Uncharacterized protein n=1 Tax=Pelobates cultripes TaxID=61616 RepID=A0AAD1S1U6_PELCU|nr:Hypothetical predicted protein [Pelobates cultripes]